MITLEGTTLVVATRYDKGLVEAIKTIPASERKYDPARKVWLVAPQHGARVKDWLYTYLGLDVKLPDVHLAKPDPRLRAFKLYYLGACKDRGGESTAFGHDGRDWSYIFPEKALRVWFEGLLDLEDAPAKTTLYGLLGIGRDAGGEAIKSAYRRMVKQWHPDVCKEANAQEVFLRIQEAYQILNDPKMRVRYDAGLMLEAGMTVKNQDKSLPGYRAPLRCGYVMAEGYDSIGRYIVKKIRAWEDIVENGQTMVVSWPAGAKQFVVDWS